LLLCVDVLFYYLSLIHRDMVEAGEAPPEAVAGVAALAEATQLRQELAKAVAAQNSLAKALQQAWAREEAAEISRINGSGAAAGEKEKEGEGASGGEEEEAGTLAAAVASTAAVLDTESK
jgi:hypothetical protein